MDINKLLEKETIKFRFEWTRRIESRRETECNTLVITSKDFVRIRNSVNEYSNTNETHMRIISLNSIISFDCTSSFDNRSAENGGRKAISVDWDRHCENLEFSCDEEGERTMEMVVNALLSIL